jgi:hypothetical protein
VSKFNFSVFRFVKTISRAGPQNLCSLRALRRRQPVHNEIFIGRSIIKWVQYACVSTMKFQSSFFKLFIKPAFTTFHLSSFGFKLNSNNRWIIHTLIDTYILYIKTLIYWDLGKAVCFVASRPPLLLLTSPQTTTTVSGPQNALFPSVSGNKW